MKGLPIIRKFEGCKLKAYICPAGVVTIGWGSTRYEDGSRVRMGDRITQDAADLLLLNEYRRFEDHVKRVVTSPINENQLGALVSFAYNVGLSALAKSTLLRLVNHSPDNAGVRDQFMRWTRGGGKILPGLVRRRKAEADLYFSKM